MKIAGGVLMDEARLYKVAPRSQGNGYEVQIRVDADMGKVVQVEKLVATKRYGPAIRKPTGLGRLRRRGPRRAGAPRDGAKKGGSAS
jgi:hypothetical protein